LEEQLEGLNDLDQEASDLILFSSMEQLCREEEKQLKELILKQEEQA